MFIAKLKGILCATLCLALMPTLAGAQAQSAPPTGPQFLVVTQVHLNTKSDFTIEQWKAIEKEYFEKVTAKNDLIMSSNVLVHYYSTDQSELWFSTTYRTWEDIDKADAKTAELEKAAWPDEAKRTEFFKKRNAMYTSEHRDEMRTILPNAKQYTGTTEAVYYIRTSRRAFPEDSKPNEFRDAMNEYNQHVIQKNTLVKGYYPSRHLYGSDSRDFVEAFVFNSLADLEKAEAENEKLAKAHWPDEAKRKEFFKSMDKYLEKWHSDAIYKHVPELRKMLPVVAAAK
jgi:hypothetical protein